MSYCEREWKRFYPYDDEEAREEMAAISDAYDPRGVAYEGDPGSAFSIRVIDQSGGVDDFWIDLWLRSNDVCMDWNDIVIFTGPYDSGGRWRVLQQGDEVITEKAFDAACEYAEMLGLIVQLPNGDWRYANPDEYAVRRDAIVSLARKARANQAKGVGKLTGRFRF